MTVFPPDPLARVISCVCALFGLFSVFVLYLGPFVKLSTGKTRGSPGGQPAMEAERPVWSNLRTHGTQRYSPKWLRAFSAWLVGGGSLRDAVPGHRQLREA